MREVDLGTEARDGTGFRVDSVRAHHDVRAYQDDSRDAGLTARARSQAATQPGGVTRLGIGGAAVDVCSRDQAIDAIRHRLVHGGRPLVVASANLDHIHHFGTGGEYRSLIPAAERTADWLVLLDGMPLVWRARHLTRTADVPRLAGSDLITDTLRLAERERRVVGFVGGTSEVHVALRHNLAASMDRVTVGGCWAPSRADILDEARGRALASEVREAGIEMLYVCLGKPRQEMWAARHAAATGAAVSLLFGAAADFLAGHQQRAPELMQATGLEWAYRLSREPRRLSRRYLLQGPPALWRTLFSDGERSA